jgi:Holliday junction resolvase-like predicted endonuclease
MCYNKFISNAKAYAMAYESIVGHQFIGDIMNFIIDFDFGQNGEDRVVHYLNLIGYKVIWRASKNKKFKFYDLIAMNELTGEVIKVEVKSERYSNDVLAVEVEYNSEPSGIHTSKADVFIYCRYDGIFVIKSDKLSDLILEKEHHKEKPRQINDTKGIVTKFYLVDRTHFNKVM